MSAFKPAKDARIIDPKGGRAPEPKPLFAVSVVLMSDGEAWILDETTFQDVVYKFIDRNTQHTAQALARVSLAAALTKLDEMALVTRMIQPLTQSITNSVLQGLSYSSVASKLAGGK